MTSTNAAVEKIKTQAKTTEVSPIIVLVEKSVKELQKALPKHLNPERITRLALTAFRQNPKLLQCEIQSVLGAIFQAAQAGLEINLDGECFLVPYNDRKKNQLVCQFQVGYKGFIKLFYNHQNSLSIVGGVVRQKDIDDNRFYYDEAAGEIRHTPDVFSDDRGEIVGYYVVAKMVNGGSNCKVMSKKECLDHAKKYSQTWIEKEQKFMYGTPWADHFDAQCMKTVLKKLAPWLPKSVEIQKALMMDDSIRVLPKASELKGALLDMTAQPAEYPVIEQPQAQVEDNSKKETEKKVTALDIKIHEAKDLLKKLKPKKSGTSKLTEGEVAYYTTLGADFSVEHMTDLNDSQKEMFLRVLQGKIQEIQKP